MSRTSEVVVTAFIGATVGIAVLLIVLALAGQWYATAASPLILLLMPGALIGLLNPISSALYGVLVLFVQIACYVSAALLLRVAVRVVRRRHRNAV
jgi:hypothetical protein